MVHHHKSNRQVEGDPDYGHGRGMPRRPDDFELERRTKRDRREAGLAQERNEAPTTYEEAEGEVDRQVSRGVMPTGGGRRKNRDTFPPTHYES
ncbi:hypothetical protein [Streptomyces sp. NPDC059906]|uniref:hypothetical protein n=1 Tax=Streptomyces sp. NPDC059906 TaxID=3346997 RepID=UPI003653377D